MQFQISWSKKKNNDWIVATVKDLHGAEFKDTSINRVNKKGEVFPNFDAIMTGHTVEATLWTSDSGKHYLFAPKPNGEAPRASQGAKTAMIEKTMARKEEGIARSQDNKELGIKTSSTIRMAVDIVTSFNKDMDAEEIRNAITYWRNWLWNNWDLPEDATPPFK